MVPAGEDFPGKQAEVKVLDSAGNTLATKTVTWQKPRHTDWVGPFARSLRAQPRAVVCECHRTIQDEVLLAPERLNPPAPIVSMVPAANVIDRKCPRRR